MCDCGAPHDAPTHEPRGQLDHHSLKRRDYAGERPPEIPSSKQSKQDNSLPIWSQHVALTSPVKDTYTILHWQAMPARVCASLVMTHEDGYVLGAMKVFELYFCERSDPPH
ncbi:uncharacterized protein PGTG_16422 [Puccinia graminis f. sp. tritici CRL 75-36-700-3]|uniref:Uncharacterized protein n=1 Tax=Puccinia graminis f. sp. tritici (strain CRL 75-36-700-3 / race SCCL) TaxID=418459 RepID=E3L3V6_PUCGT|nr:uncharacterized protein PGTG_16422 [Puccinia graminis f. sp. tritici CRL 75-36-700-3]EFP91231.2 hypothetical protein PGTG_16422 [Puccinia graminis f. sp. tritici CRL 75-36-700-3]